MMKMRRCTRVTGGSSGVRARKIQSEIRWRRLKPGLPIMYGGSAIRRGFCAVLQLALEFAQGSGFRAVAAGAARVLSGLALELDQHFIQIAEAILLQFPGGRIIADLAGAVGGIDFSGEFFALAKARLVFLEGGLQLFHRLHQGFGSYAAGLGLRQLVLVGGAGAGAVFDSGVGALAFIAFGENSLGGL